MTEQKQVIPEGYKQTEIGVLPEDWISGSLGDNTINIGSGRTSTKGSGDYPLFGSTGVIGSCLNGEYEGDAILVARVGANAGKINFVTGKYGVSDNTIIVKFKNSVDIAYFRYQLDRKNLNTLVFGSGQPLITGSQLKEILFPLPPKYEQTAIANALSDVDALISELEKFIAKKQAIKTATMQQLLTGKTRLPPFSLREDGTPKGYKASELGEIPEDWKVVKFLDATNLITCGIAATPTYVKENVGVPFLSSTNVKAGRIIWENHKYISYDLHNQLYRNNPPLKGDALYSRVGTIGEAAVIEEDFEFSIYVSLTLIKPKSSMLNSYFLSHLLNSKPYKQRASDQVYLGGGVGNLNVDIVRNYPISIPKLEEQVSISSILSDMDEEIQTLQQRLNKTRQIKQGMMQELLTGKTRLVKPEVTV